MISYDSIQTTLLLSYLKTQRVVNTIYSKYVFVYCKSFEKSFKVSQRLILS